MQQDSSTKPCEECGKPLSGNRLRWKHSRFCSNQCKATHYDKYGSTHKVSCPNLTKASIGALHELMVTCDLIKRGCQMFRAVSSSCDCDLAIMKNKKLIRVEVTTGYKTQKGKILYHKHKPENFDLMAVVAVDGIHYYPPELLDNL